MIQSHNPLFSLGTVVATPGVLATVGFVPGELLRRHQAGDWGDIPPEDIEENNYAVDHGLRILSSYDINGTTVWVITEADRSVTTFLLPSEY